MKKACWRWVNRSAKKSVEAGASVRDIDQHLFSTSAYATCDFSLVKRGRCRLKSARKGQRKLSVFPPLFNFQTGGIVCIGKNSSSGVLNFAFFFLSFLFSEFSPLSLSENVFDESLKFYFLFLFPDRFINFPKVTGNENDLEVNWINRRVALRWIFHLHRWRFVEWWKHTCSLLFVSLLFFLFRVFFF